MILNWLPLKTWSSSSSITFFLISISREDLTYVNIERIFFFSGRIDTGGCGEYVVVDLILIGKEKLILVIGAKGFSVGEAMKRCLLKIKGTR